MFNKKISIKTYNILTNLLFGIALIISSLVIVEEKNITFGIIGLIALVVALILLLVDGLIDVDGYDEMFEAHKKAAKARSLDIILGVLLTMNLFATISTTVFKRTIISDWRAFALILVGTIKILTAYFFARYEKEGDTY